VAPDAPGTIRFAAAEIGKASSGKPELPDVILEVTNSGPAQSYGLERNGNTWRVLGADAVGAMYGGLDVAEAIRTGALDVLKTGQHQPFIAQRGIKFNTPLDLRTPSYSDNSDASQANIPEMWSMDFWHAFLDEMSRARFNVLSLWSLHPFPSLVKVPEFPDVALDDVWRARWNRGRWGSSTRRLRLGC